MGHSTGGAFLWPHLGRVRVRDRVRVRARVRIRVRRRIMVGARLEAWVRPFLWPHHRAWKRASMRMTISRCGSEPQPSVRDLG